MVLGHPPVVVPASLDHAAETLPITGRLRRGQGLAQDAVSAVELGEDAQAGPELEAHVDGVLDPTVGEGEAFERREGVLEVRHGFPIGRVRDRAIAGLTQIRDGARPDLALTVVQPERGGVRRQLIGVERLDRLRDLTVQQASAGVEQLPGDDLANAIVDEIEALACRAKDAVPYQLLQPIDRARDGDSGRAAKEVEREVPPDNRRHRHRRRLASLSRLEPGPDQLPHALGNRQDAVVRAPLSARARESSPPRRTGCLRSLPRPDRRARRPPLPVVSRRLRGRAPWSRVWTGPRFSRVTVSWRKRSRSGSRSSSSSSRAVPTTRTDIARSRRLAIASSRRLISSAQCRSLSTTITGCDAATQARKLATDSNSRRWETGPSAAGASSGRSRASSLAQIGASRDRISGSSVRRSERIASTQDAYGKPCAPG